MRREAGARGRGRGKEKPGGRSVSTGAYRSREENEGSGRKMALPLSAENEGSEVDVGPSGCVWNCSCEGLNGDQGVRALGAAAKGRGLDSLGPPRAPR